MSPFHWLLTPKRWLRISATSWTRWRAWGGGRECGWRMSMLAIRASVGRKHIVTAGPARSSRRRPPHREHGVMVDSRRVETLRFRFPDRSRGDLVLGPGVHAVGHGPDGLRLV